MPTWEASESRRRSEYSVRPLTVFHISPVSTKYKCAFSHDMHWHRPTQLHSACQQQRRKLYILPKSCIARSPPPPHPPPRAPRYLRPQTLPWPLLPPSSSPNLKLTLLTQCLSSVGVGYPSPLKTCPKWPPQLLHTISVRCIPNAPSTCRVTAPGMLSKYAGHPQPDLNLCDAL